VDEEDLKTARIDAFLSKPLRQAQLLESLAAVTRRRTGQGPVGSRGTAPGAAPRRLIKARVLLAEDNLFNQKIASRQLESWAAKRCRRERPGRFGSPGEKRL